MTYRAHRGAYRAPPPSNWRGRSAVERRPIQIRQRRTIFVSYGRLAILLICLAAIVFLSWRIIEISAGRSLVLAGQVQMALAWDGSSAAALDGVAEHALRTAGPSDVARQAALDALATSPLDDRAFAVLALDVNRRGNHDLSAKLMQVAGRRSWRNSVTQAWLFSNDVAGRRYLSALEHLDALLRLNEDNMGAFFPLIASFTILPDSLVALSSYLGESPPWRLWALKDLAARLRNDDNLVRVFEGLQRTPVPPTDDETASLLDRLVKDQQYKLAREVADKLQRDNSESQGWLYNGDFSRALNGSPFNWRITDRRGVETAVEKDLDGKSALRLDFAGRAPLIDVQQLVTLAPGLWSFSGEVRAAQLKSDMGVGWRVTCADSGRPLIEPELETGNFEWKKFSLEFRVPEQDCKAQRLTLVHPSRVASEEMIQGQIWYRNLQIASKAVGARP